MQEADITGCGPRGPEEVGGTTVSEESLFHQALAKSSAGRAAFLDAACAGQPELRAAVEALLAAHAASGSLPDRPPGGLSRTVDSEPAAGRPGGTGEYSTPS